MTAANAPRLDKNFDEATPLLVSGASTEASAARIGLRRFARFVLEIAGHGGRRRPPGQKKVSWRKSAGESRCISLPHAYSLASAISSSSRICDKIRQRQKSIFHRHFSLRRSFRFTRDAKCRTSRPRCRMSKLAGVRAKRAGKRQKDKKCAESLFFFFFRSNPVAVQVDSRLHCTISPSTQARRAAMAKKRKAKAATKKAAKKTAKRGRKKK